MRDRVTSHKSISIDFNRKDEIDARFVELGKKDPAISTIAGHVEQYPTFAETILKAGLIAYSETVADMAEELFKHETDSIQSNCPMIAGARAQVKASGSPFLTTVMAFADRDPKSATAYWMLAALSAYNTASEIAGTDSKE